MDGMSNARQQHGMDFERWLKETFFQSYIETGYTDKWDILGGTFKSEYFEHTGGLANLPISIKTCKYGMPIGFGDAIRQFENQQDFLLIVGFWLPDGSGKRFVSVKAVKISASEWHRLFEGKITPNELQKDVLDSEGVKNKIYHLDSVIKSVADYRNARILAQQTKKQLPAMDIVLNPKIDSKSQRRLQCSLPFQVFLDKFAKEPALANPLGCTFWGETVPVLG